MRTMKTLAIIGGGAGGLACAVQAARTLRACDAAAKGNAARDGVRVVVYEADDERVGRSILATGNGRCNFSNAHIDAGLYRSSAFVAAALGALRRGEDGRAAAAGLSSEGGFAGGAGASGAAAACPAGPAGSATGDPVHGFFADLGLLWREEAEGRLYPLPNKASAVLDVLRAAARSLGVEMVCGHRAVRIDAPERPGGRFRVRFADKSVEHAEAIVVAVGGRAMGKLKMPGGLPMRNPHPTLGPLRTDNRLTRQLNNIRVRGSASIVRDGRVLATERGEVLFRDYGVSGVAVFNLSRTARPGDTLSLDFLPDVAAVDAQEFLRARSRRMAGVLGGELSCEAFASGMLLPQVARVLLGEAALDGAAAFDDAATSALARVLKGFALEVQGIGDERQCQVMRGGLEVESFDPRTCEALGVPGLFAVGEALDVDAPCGGYNLHWAWASGMLAGRAAASALACRN